MTLTVDRDLARGLYADYLTQNDGDPDLDGVPAAEDLTDEDLDEMIEDYNFRTDHCDRFNFFTLWDLIIQDWLDDWNYCNKED